jgi:hypothetical protein
MEDQQPTLSNNTKQVQKQKMGKFGFSFLNLSGLALSGIILVAVVVVAIMTVGYFNLVPRGDDEQAAAGDAPIPNAVTFQDSFDNRLLTGWTITDDTKVQGPSNWSVMENGVVRQASNIAGGSSGNEAFDNPGTYMTAGNPGWKNYEFTSRFKTTDTGPIGVMFRYTDGNNYYRFSVDNKRGVQRLVKKVNGKYTKLAEIKTMTTIDQWHDVKVRVIGSNIQISLDGKVIMTKEDPSLPSGMIGLYAWGNKAAFFDDVKVKATVESFTVAVLPDTQYYAGNYRDPHNPSSTYPNVYTDQTEWLAKNRGQQKIAFVLHEGDLVQYQFQKYNWDNASESMAYLDGKIPQAVANGNHDVIDYPELYRAPYNAKNTPGAAGTTPFNYYFPVGRYSKDATFGGTKDPNKIDNAYYLFDAGGVKYLVVALTFGPSDADLEWAGKVISQHPDRKVMIVTHSYLMYDDTLHDRNKYCPQVELPRCPVATGSIHSAFPRQGNDGQQMWDKLVKKYPNIEFVFSGHVANGDMVGRRVGTGDNGNKVYEMLANYQSLPPLSGNGYIRLLKFYPAQKKVEVTTFSPYCEKNPKVCKPYLTDPQNQFTLENVAM